MEIKMGFLFILLAIFSLSACSAGGKGAMMVSEIDAGKTIELNKDDLLDISLEGNLTTGFTWEVVAQDPVLFEVSLIVK